MPNESGIYEHRVFNFSFFFFGSDRAVLLLFFFRPKVFGVHCDFPPSFPSDARENTGAKLRVSISIGTKAPIEGCNGQAVGPSDIHGSRRRRCSLPLFQKSIGSASQPPLLRPAGIATTPSSLPLRYSSLCAEASLCVRRWPGIDFLFFSGDERQRLRFSLFTAALLRELESFGRESSLAESFWEESWRFGFCTGAADSRMKSCCSVD